MPRKVPQQSLSAAFVRTIVRPGMYADGNGLNLKVVPSGSRWWVQRVTIGGPPHSSRREREIQGSAFPVLERAAD